MKDFFYCTLHNAGGNSVDGCYRCEVSTGSGVPAHLLFEYGLPNMTEYTQGFYSGRQWEQARIIKLIEKHDAEIVRDDLIALIKGENK